MNFRILTGAFMLAGMQVNAQKVSSLVIKEGETKTLAAGTYNFSKIDIHSGGKLVVAPKSSDWLILNSSGDVNIHGTIECKNFKSGKETHKATAPDGTRIEYAFLENNTGGNGGTGGKSGSDNKFFGSGGTGAAGSTTFGGGGGGGGKYNPKDTITKRAQKGMDAKDNLGVKIKPGGNEGSGGNGAVRDPFGNGGLVYIFCGGNLDGSSGLIDASANDGSNGSEGANQMMHKQLTSGDGAGGGGGGGGAPGGEGGNIRIKIVGKTTYFPRILVNAGRGGRGAEGGKGSFSGSSNGSKGEDGKDGNNGHVDILH